MSSLYALCSTCLWMGASVEDPVDGFVAEYGVEEYDNRQRNPPNGKNGKKGKKGAKGKKGSNPFSCFHRIKADQPIDIY